MSYPLQTGVIAVLLALGAPIAAQTSQEMPGASIEGLLALAQASNPEYASMRYEAQAALEGVAPAGALMDPKFRIEWMDITKMGEQSPTLWPSDVGSTIYTLMQDIPWFGKRELKRDIAQFEAQSSEGKALGAWSELAARIKTAQAQRYYLDGNEKLTREILDLMARLEQVAQSRYAGGLAAQQDVIRSQVEQTNMRNELVMLESERLQVDARLNALLARPSQAPLARPNGLRPTPAAALLDPARLEQRVRSHNPQLFSEEARIHAAEKSRDLSYKNRYPDFTLAISPTQIDSRIKEWSLMLEVNIPLQQTSRRAMEREAQAMVSAAHARKEAAANQVLAELAQNLAGLEAARRTEALAATSLLPQADLSFNSALASYENGKLDFAALLDAQRQIRQAKQSRIKAQFEGQMRLAEIEKLVGEDL
ncbi:MAG: TolC family protein [Gammaproteobacteria bacterium]|uniref:TolC family protein n=1 Tax=Rhodoferax sp. TaxID=50421 RepID=UPI00181518B3|nr:TolC family protein [Rhodoferax sp.]MBU3898378.1 TolC family protein [Gammaproteobacteria bacterium]MBA3059357.1 TolC family protein [Rhodoferax sp.]MBU3998097.1 TolC family protein [Gammaproteobacteria bacterium]MBU4079152.1 TolC family protein [Gammaproteobacteria bacterium]MBU4113783.1 TolC family protein [Gammaproteobacteria bacterium]